MPSPSMRVDTAALQTPSGRFLGRVIISRDDGGTVKESFIDGTKEYDTADEAMDCIVDELEQRGKA